ncbi:AAA family ATPase [Shewanella marisflavi]|uniref:AAA family ATPase n=1 Tax=Shewanella marisflavi TaxID=260364 RepID=UPI003AAF38A6
MTFQTAILLPSQESLLHRLQHVVLYGQQLTVLTGDAGSGKTTLTTALVDALDEVSSALVVCPQHVDSAEIRRKILVQLLTEPLFDDEVPLPETLLRLVDALPSHSHIVLDDAHYLPLELWAECIVLSQLTLPGKQLSLTLTTPVEYFNQILAQLPDSQRPLLLPMAIAPLTEAEREGLYYSLLHRSEETPFTPREIVKEQLLKQQGMPAEVVSLLYLALHGDPHETSQRSWQRNVFICVCFTLLLLGSYWMFAESDEASIIPSQQTVSAVRASEFNQAYGKHLLSGYFAAKSRVASVEATEPIETDTALQQESKTVSEIPEPPSEEVIAAEELVDQVVEPATEQALAFNEESESRVNERVETFAVTPPAEPQEALKSALSSPEAEHPQGFTLQLATVKNIDSLKQTIAKLPDANQVQIARYKAYWVLLYGQYADREQGKQAALNLSQQAQLPSPWVRAWADLSGYQLQQGSASSEIH